MSTKPFVVLGTLVQCEGIYIDNARIVTLGSNRSPSWRRQGRGCDLRTLSQTERSGHYNWKHFSKSSHRVLEPNWHAPSHPLEVVLDELKLLACRKLRLDHIQEHGRRKDGAAVRIKSFRQSYLWSPPVDHWVVGLPVGIKGNLVVPTPTRLFAHELANTLGAQMGKARKLDKCTADSLTFNIGTRSTWGHRWMACWLIED